MANIIDVLRKIPVVGAFTPDDPNAPKSYFEQERAAKLAEWGDKEKKRQSIEKLANLPSEDEENMAKMSAQDINRRKFEQARDRVISPEGQTAQGPIRNPELNPFNPDNQEMNPFESKRDAFTKSTGVPKEFLGLTTDEAKDMALISGKNTFSNVEGLGRVSNNTIFTQNSLNQRQNISNPTLRDALPNVSDDELQKIFGVEGIDGNTRLTVANTIGKSIQTRLDNDFKRDNRLFPVSALNPEAQLAAQNAGMGAFVTAEQARILGQANPVRLATAEEIKSLASADSIISSLSRIKSINENTNYKGIGFGSHFINRVGQYSPIDGLKTDPQMVTLYTAINDIKNKIIYMYSGAQINENEYERLSAAAPDPNLNPEAFVARYNEFERIFNEVMQSREGRLSSMGKRTGNPSAQSNPQGGQSGNSGAGWDNSKEQRYQELLKKKQEGTLR